MNQTEVGTIVYHPQHRVGVVQQCVGTERLVAFVAAEDQWVHRSEVTPADNYFQREEWVLESPPKPPLPQHDDWPSKALPYRRGKEWVPKPLRRFTPAPVKKSVCIGYSTNYHTRLLLYFAQLARLEGAEVFPSPNSFFIESNEYVCGNLRAAWADDEDRKYTPLDRCYCDQCLDARAQEVELTPRPFIPTAARCRGCGAVDGAKYGKKRCEIKKGLCDRTDCVRSRRFKGNIETIPYKDTTPVHRTLRAWASRTTPQPDFNETGRYLNELRYGSKIEYCPKSRYARAAEVHYPSKVGYVSTKTTLPFTSKYAATRLDFGTTKKYVFTAKTLDFYQVEGRWRVRVIDGESFDVLLPGSRACDAEFLSQREAVQRRTVYNSHPQVLATYAELLRKAPLVEDHKRPLANTMGASTELDRYIILFGLNPNADADAAAKEEARLHKAKVDLPELINQGREIFSTLFTNEEERARFEAEVAAFKQDYPELVGAKLEDLSEQDKIEILSRPRAKRIRILKAKVDGWTWQEIAQELDPGTDPDTLKHRTYYPLPTFAEELAAVDAPVGSITFTVGLAGGSVPKITVPPNATAPEILNVLFAERDKSVRNARNNAKAKAKKQGLDAAATEALILEDSQRVEKAYVDVEEMIKSLY